MNMHDDDELNPTLEAGDCVVMKSGGAEMVIEKMVDEFRAGCLWQDRDGSLHHHVFPVWVLRKTDGVLRIEPDDDE